MIGSTAHVRSLRRRGVALVMVIALILLATVLGFAMLSGSMLQMRAGGNLTKSAEADYLAESGLNLAMYYLQNPTLAPSLNASGYWSGTGGDVTIDSSISGTINVTVTQDSSNQWVYEVSSLGKAGINSGSQISRTTSARFYVRSQYLVKQAAAFNASATLYSPTNIDGDVYASKALSIKTGSRIGGTLYSPYNPTLQLGASGPIGGTVITTFNAQVSPTTSDVNTYQTYSYQDITYSASTLSSSSLTGTAGISTLDISSSNPAGIWVCSNDLTLNDNVTINGTLIVMGNLTVNGAGIVVTPASGFPGLIVTTNSSGLGGKLTIKQQSKSMTVNGVVFCSTLAHSGTPLPASAASTFNVYGGLFIGTGSGTPIDSSFNVNMYVKLDSTKNKAPDLSSVGRTPSGVSIIRWGPAITPPY